MATHYDEGKLYEIAQMIMELESDQSVTYPCNICALVGHSSEMCPLLHEEVQEPSYYWPNQWNEEQYQYDTWGYNNQAYENPQYDIPNQAWGYDHYQPNPYFQEPYYPPYQPESSTPSLEDIVRSIAIDQQETLDDLKRLEQCLSQLTQSVSILDAQRSLPSQEEDQKQVSYATSFDDEDSFDEVKSNKEDEEEEEEEVEVIFEEVLKEDEVHKVKLPTNFEKLIPIEVQPQEPTMFNFLKPLKDVNPEKENNRPIINSTTLSKVEELILEILSTKIFGCVNTILKPLSPEWYKRKKKVKYKGLSRANDFKNGRLLGRQPERSFIKISSF